MWSSVFFPQTETVSHFSSACDWGFFFLSLDIRMSERQLLQKGHSLKIIIPGSLTTQRVMLCHALFIQMSNLLFVVGNYWASAVLLVMLAAKCIDEHSMVWAGGNMKSQPGKLNISSCIYSIFKTKITLNCLCKFIYQFQQVCICWSLQRENDDDFMNAMQTGIQDISQSILCKIKHCWFWVHSLIPLQQSEAKYSSFSRETTSSSGERCAQLCFQTPDAPQG